MPAIPQEGRTKIRDAIKTLITHIGFSDDQTAFNDADTTLSPGGAGTELVKATASEDNVDGDSFDAVAAIDGDSEFTGATIWTIAAMNGSGVGDIVSRRVRSQGIGVQAGDSFTVGVRWLVEDNTP